MRCILRAAITMKNKSGWRISLLISHLKRGRDELGTVLLWNLICDHFAWEKINDHADIEIVIFEFKAANIADPPLIWLISSKLLLQEIFLSLRLTQLLIFLLCCHPNAAQPHFAHEPWSILLTDLMTSLNKDRLNFLRAQHLLIFIEHIVDQLAILLSALLKPGIFTLVS